MRRDTQSDDRSKGLHRDDVPSLVRDNVSSQEIDIGNRVAAFYSAAGGGGDAVGVALDDGGRFHLHAEEARAGVHDEIITGALAIGLADGEAQAGDTPQKAHLGPL